MGNYCYIYDVCTCIYMYTYIYNVLYYIYYNHCHIYIYICIQRVCSLRWGFLTNCTAFWHVVYWYWYIILHMVACILHICRTIGNFSKNQKVHTSSYFSHMEIDDFDISIDFATSYGPFIVLGSRWRASHMRTKRPIFKQEKQKFRQHLKEPWPATGGYRRIPGPMGPNVKWKLRFFMDFFWDLMEL